MKEYFVIDRLHKDDIREVLPMLDANIACLSDADMKRICEKLADDYHNQLFWESLKEIAHNYIKENVGK